MRPAITTLQLDTIEYAVLYYNCKTKYMQKSFSYFKLMQIAIRSLFLTSTLKNLQHLHRWMYEMNILAVAESSLSHVRWAGACAPVIWPSEKNLNIIITSAKHYTMYEIRTPQEMCCELPYDSSGPVLHSLVIMSLQPSLPATSEPRA